MKGAFLLTGLLTAGGPMPRLCRADGLGEDVRGGGFGASNHVGVHPERDGRVRVTQASSDDVGRNAVK